MHLYMNRIEEERVLEKKVVEEHGLNTYTSVWK